MATTPTIFERLAGPPDAIREVSFTAAFAAVLEHEPQFAREFGHWIFRRLERNVDLCDTTIDVQTEVTIPEGGRLDLVIEYRNSLTIVASIVAENKLDAPITNPLEAYRREVQGRQVREQESALLLVSRRNAENDDELLPMWDWDSFLFMSWHEVYRWLRDLPSKVTNNWLTEEFIRYMEGMGLDNSGRFSEQAVTFAPLYTELMENMDRVLGDPMVREAMKGLSFQTRSPVKEERGPDVHALYTFVQPNTAYIAAVGFAFTNSPTWKDVLDAKDPIVLFAAVGATARTDQELDECLAWLQSRKRFGDLSLSQWRRIGGHPEYPLLTWQPLTSFMQGEDHLSACRVYLLERIVELTDVLKPVKQGQQARALLTSARVAAGLQNPPGGTRGRR